MEEEACGFASLLQKEIDESGKRDDEWKIRCCKRDKWYLCEADYPHWKLLLAFGQFKAVVRKPRLPA